MQIQFPSSFLWGAAISSYQCEGRNFNTDWHRWEKAKGLDRAGWACDHYRLFEKDFYLAKSLNLNSFRLSIEWARVCPVFVEFSQEALDHYSEVIDVLHQKGLKPVVTLHHFTNPTWFIDRGGWLNSKNIDYFIAYLKRVVELLKEKVEYWIIFNEPLVYIYNGFIRGIWPPGVKSVKEAKKVLDNIVQAYLIGYEEIKRIYETISMPVQISLAKHMRVFSGCPGSNFALNSLSAFLRNKYFNFWIVEYLNKKRSLDFLALNYYCKEYTRFKGLIGAECRHTKHRERKNDLGWDIHPKGFYNILLKLKKFNLPIIITENGTAETKDSLYEDYLRQHLKHLAKAILKGVDIKGYFWWSLLDNFEWDKGFKYRFGLIEVAYDSMVRRIKPFAYVYAQVCKENKIEV